MSQPPQNGWGQQPPSGDPFGQDPQGGYGQPSPNGGYGQDQPGGFGQGQQNAGQDQQGYGQQSANGAFGQQNPQTQQNEQGGFGNAPSFAPAFGDSGQMPTEQLPVKKGPGKLPFIIGGCCVLLILALIVVGGGIFLFARSGGDTPGGGGETTTQEETTTEETTDEETTAEEPTTEEPTTDEATTDEATTEEETTAAAGDGKGTEDSPYALGETFTIDDGDGGKLDVTLGDVNWDATSTVMDVSSSNTEPGDDSTYILVPVKLTYHGDGTAEPGFAIMVEYVSAAGNTYSDEYALTPNDWLDVGTLHDGGTGEWDTAIIVPKDQVKKGSFTVQALLDFTAEPTWVAAA